MRSFLVPVVKSHDDSPRRTPLEHVLLVGVGKQSTMSSVVSWQALSARLDEDQAVSSR